MTDFIIWLFFAVVVLIGLLIGVACVCIALYIYIIAPYLERRYYRKLIKRLKNKLKSER